MFFNNTELMTALECLAGQMNRRLHVGWEVEGRVTANLWGITPEAGLIRVLAMQPEEYDYWFIDGDSPGLLVARTDNMRRIESIFGSTLPPQLPDKLFLFESTLETTPVDKILKFLATQYDNIVFAPHSEPKSFYALGGREDLVGLKRDLATGGVEMATVASIFLRIQKADPEELVRVLSCELPGLEISYEGQEIQIAGPRNRLSGLHLLVKYLKKPLLGAGPVSISRHQTTRRRLSCPLAP